VRGGGSGFDQRLAPMPGTDAASPGVVLPMPLDGAVVEPPVVDPPVLGEVCGVGGAAALSRRSQAVLRTLAPMSAAVAAHE